MDTNRYNQIVKKDPNFKQIKIKVFVPSPNEFDYKRGYITRYFAQKINDPSSNVYEIDENEFSKLGENVFYKTVSIDWKLIGTDEQIKEANSKSILLGSKKMKALQLYLPNLLQFKKINE